MTKTASLAALAVAALTTACAPTSHPVTPSALGVARSTAALEAVVDLPGPVTVETVIGADWEVPRAGVVNLDHPAAKAAGLRDGAEPIHIAFHALQHPDRGLYLVDTGVERAFRTDPGHALITGLVASAMNLGTMRVRTDTASWIAAEGSAGAGRLPHAPGHATTSPGSRDVSAGAPVFAGPGEASEKTFLTSSPATPPTPPSKGAIRN